jgi:hypothetical protein
VVNTPLVLGVVYFVLDADYNVYMNIQSAVRLALFRGRR